jgi:hypothetical protein
MTTIIIIILEKCIHKQSHHSVLGKFWSQTYLLVNLTLLNNVTQTHYKTHGYYVILNL